MVLTACLALLLLACVLFVLRRISTKALFVGVVFIFGTIGASMAGTKEFGVGVFAYAWPVCLDDGLRQVRGFCLGGLPFCLLLSAMLWHLPRTRDLEDEDGPRCRECGYLLKGLPEPRCPECGTSFESGRA